MKKKKDMFKEELINFVHQDFLKRQQERKAYEAQWKLNNNFYHGEQYLNINKLFDIESSDKMYFWQEREVFNHISPIIDARLAKLNLVRPQMEVLSTSSNDDDKRTAKLSQEILRNVYEKLDLSKVISKATHWSEICGTSFYKVVWNSLGGKEVFNSDGKPVFEGEVEVVAIPPFEIYPDSASHENIADCESIIHAKIYSTKEIKSLWGVDVESENISQNSLSNKDNSTLKNHAVVIERYESPSSAFPNGRLHIVCGKHLLYEGDLPFENGVSGRRIMPFVKQVSTFVPGQFWGSSIIEKLIPVQRAYNAVKNRKHEFINRLSMGVLMVEDGSVDIDDLEQDGLQPGKVIVYKQGANMPKFLNESSLPDAFNDEEESLLLEFGEISGVNSTLSGQLSKRNLSGSAIELLMEQDGTKLASTIDEINLCVKEIAKMILRLYKQFAVMPRLINIAGDSDSITYFKSSDLGLDDIQFLSESTLGDSLFKKREQLLSLLNSDILKNEFGEVDKTLKAKVLELFGINLPE